jgi:hypothetical protein
MNDITAPILTAGTLAELLIALNEAGNEINRLQQDGLDASTLIGDYGRSVSECPTFGGDEPEDTAGVWSWDDTHLLVGEGWGSCELVARGEW